MNKTKPIIKEGMNQKIYKMLGINPRKEKQVDINLKEALQMNLSERTPIKK